MPRHVPKLCGPRADGRYYATDPAGGRVYFGTDPAAAEVAYEGWRLRYLARTPGIPAGVRVTVARLAAAFLAHADLYYRKGGRHTTEYRGFRDALDCCRAFAELPADLFGPAELKAARLAMVERGWSRGTVNAAVGRLRRVWSWAVEEQLVPVAVLHTLREVAPLRKGRTPAPEPVPVGAVALEVLEATLPWLRRERMRALVLTHLATGMRAEEVVALRPVDLDTSGTPWVYRVPDAAYKLAHQEGDPKRVPVGPRGRKALAPLLARARRPDSWLFPTGTGARSTSRTGHLTVGGYRATVGRAVVRANRARAREKLPLLPHWYPLMVRHRALTDVRARYGLEGAAAIGGHTQLETTQVYSERNWRLACEIAEAMG